MARVNQPIKIKPVPYNFLGDPDSSIATGESFTCDKPFLLLCSKPIPTYSKVYMELTVTKQITNKSIRHIPLYLGLHKEPSFGMLNNDCVFGSCYYPVGGDFDIFEKPKGSLGLSHQTVGKLKSRIPIVNSVIGLGVDTFENTISIFCDGKLFYSFKPKLFNIDADSGIGDRWYFAVYSSLYQSIGGGINYGRYRTKYLPEGYYTLYQHYWDHSYIDPPRDISSKIKVSGVPPYSGSKRYDYNCKVNTVNTYATIDPLTNRRRVYLEHKVPAMDNGADNSYKMIANRGGSAPDMSTVCYPCPCEDTPVYLELTTKEATMMTDSRTGALTHIGIPIEVGLTVKKNDYLNKSFRVCLYHIKGDNFKSYAVNGGVQTYYNFPPVMNPSMPVQPNTVGFIFDRKHNKIKIVTEGSIFCEIPIQGVDFSDFHEDVYIFFKSADDAYKSYQLGYVEFGEEPIMYEITEPGVKTVYDYWNDSIRTYLTDFPEFSCRMKVRIPVDFVRYDILSSLFVPRTKENCNGFDNGLNMMWNTFNVVTDTEPHNNDPTMSVFDFFEYVKEDLANYTKKGFELFIPSKLDADSGSMFSMFILDGFVTFTRPRWYDMDCIMNVVRTLPTPYTRIAYLHGTVYYRMSKFLDAMLTGFVTFDSSNRNPGYPKWVVINSQPIRAQMNDTWVNKDILWGGPHHDSDYTRDTSVNPRLILSVRPVPVDIPIRKGTIEVFYNGTSLGTKYFDPTTEDNPRDYVHKEYTIPTAIYSPNNHNIKVTVTSDTGCTFITSMVFLQINVFAITGI